MWGVELLRESKLDVCLYRTFLYTQSPRLLNLQPNSILNETRRKPPKCFCCLLGIAMLAESSADY